MPSFPVLATDFEYLDCVLNYISSDQMINNTLYIMGVVPCRSRANGPVLDFERLRLIVNSLILEVSISRERLERSSNIAGSSELDKERTKELVYYTTCLYT